MLQKRQRFNISYPDFRNYHIWVGIFGNPLDAFFNFIRDVGNHLHCSPYGRRDALYLAPPGKLSQW